MTKTTGWSSSTLMQDDCKELSKWLAKPTTLHHSCHVEIIKDTP